MIIMFTYLTGTRQETCMATHQVSKYSSNPNTLYFNTVKLIVKHLLGTKDKGLILKPGPSKEIEFYLEADFAGSFDKKLKTLKTFYLEQDASSNMIIV